MKTKRKRRKKRKTTPMEPRILREIKEGVYEVSSSSIPYKTYRVNILKKRCSCPGYNYTLWRTGGMCKHLRYVEAVLEEKDRENREKTAEKEQNYENTITDPYWLEFQERFKS